MTADERQRAVTIEDAIERAGGWHDQHVPFDRVARLPLFQFVTEGSGGALLPLAEARKEVDRYDLSQHALGQLIDRVDYGRRLFTRPTREAQHPQPQLADSEHAERGRADSLLRVMDGHTVRAILSAQYEAFDNLELLRMVQPHAEGGLVRWDYTADDVMHLSVSFPSTQVDIRPGDHTYLPVGGDIVERGIHIANSEVGVRSVTIAAYVYRLVCRNGLIGYDSGGSMFRMRHVGDSDRLHDMVGQAIETCLLEADHTIDRFREAMNLKISEPVSYLERVTKERAVTQEDFKAILDTLVNDPVREGQDGRTLFDISQAISATAQKFDGERSFALQALSTQVLT